MKTYISTSTAVEFLSTIVAYYTAIAESEESNEYFAGIKAVNEVQVGLLEKVLKDFMERMNDCQNDVDCDGRVLIKASFIKEPIAVHLDEEL